MSITNTIKPLLYEVHLTEEDAKCLQRTWLFDFTFQEVKSKVKGMKCLIINVLINTPYFTQFYNRLTKPYLVREFKYDEKHNRVYGRINMSDSKNYLKPIKQPYRILRQQFEDYQRSQLLESL